MSPLPPAAWYPDPEQPGQQRYWDGAAWTEHRAPVAGTSAQALTQVGNDVAHGVATAFTRAETWFQERSAAQPPTFAQIAAGCRDEAPRHPLSTAVEVPVGPGEVLAVRHVLADQHVAITAAGVTHQIVCRLVPNPWNPQDPGAVAALVGPHQVGLLPPATATAYVDGLVRLSQQRLLLTGTADLWAEYVAGSVNARVTLHLPEPSALG